MALTLDFQELPIPGVRFSVEFDSVHLNRAYLKAYGENLRQLHETKIRDSLEAGRTESWAQLLDGTFVAFFEPELEKLARRDALIRDATQMARVGGWEYDIETRQVRWSDEMFAIHEVGHDFEPTYQSSLDFYPTEAREHLEALVVSAIESGRDYDVELPMVTSKGAHIWIRTRGHPEFKDGKCIRLSGAYQEVTEERETRSQLADVLERFASAQESAAFGVWDYDPATGSLHWDEAMFSLYDVSRLTFRGQFQDWADCVHSDDIGRVSDSLQKAMEGDHEFDTEFRIIIRDGSIRWIKATAHITRGAEGQASRLVGFNYNITSIKRVEEQLRESYAELERTNVRLEELAAASQAASQAKSDFLANMSHEIRTPMNGVVGMTSLLMESDLTPRQRDSVDVIRKSADALLQLINDLLDFSKVEAGAVRLDKKDIDLRDAVDDLVEFLAIEAQRKQLTFTYTVDSQVPRLVSLDAGRLRQILINLVGNAVKYTQSGGVSLHLGSENEQLVFTVADTGRGVKASELESIFDPFTRGDDQGVVGGTGLGLAICRRLAELMQGEIRVESEEGVGSRFSLRLPLERVEDSHEHPQPLAGRRVAVTGGAGDDRDALQEALTFLGAEYLQDDPELELVFAGQTPRFPECKSVAVLSAAEGSRFKELQKQGFAGAVTYPFRSRPLEKILVNILSGRQGEQPSSKRLDQDKFHCRVLLAEDNEVNQKVATKMLSKLGAKFEVAADGQEALEALSRSHFDLVLMDLQMPRLDGLEATIALRSRRASAVNSNVPVVALTAHATDDHRKRCFESGMSDFLTKPLRLKDLRRVLREWLPPHLIVRQ